MCSVTLFGSSIRVVGGPEKEEGGESESVALFVGGNGARDPCGSYQTQAVEH
jgi:hypothetical protein